MKLVTKLLLFLLAFLPMLSFAQSGPPAPSTGIWAIIDTTYTVGTTTQGITEAKLTLKNTTLTKYTGVQFRVFYDKIAFVNASVALLGSSTNLDMQQVVNAANGYITVTLVYTGSSSTYTLADQETFKITFTHAAQSVFNNLTAIDDLTWTGVQTFPAGAAAQDGSDVTLGLHSYGGEFIFQNFDYHGTFTNVTGTPAKNLVLALEKRPATGGTWTQVNTYTTDINGDFAISEPIDTTYWDVRLAIQGDTMLAGNVISTSDAQLVNQWVLGTSTMSGFDYYAADVNGSNNTTIADAYGVFGRVSGRFTAWPNNVKDIKFFTAAEYATINGSSTNYTATIPGATNFTFDIVPGAPDSVVYYVAVPGDANGTGYHMARVTPIEILIDPTPGVESQIYNVIDNKVEYDFATSQIEVNVPRLTVQEGNVVNIPVKVFTNGIDLNALQFGLKYDPTLLSFSGVYATSNSTEWLTYINPNDGQVDWGGYDVTDNKSPLKDGDEVITLQFVALKPQAQWDNSPLSTTNKFAGKAGTSKDLTITPTNGIIQVVKMSNNVISIDDNSMQIIPNPVKDVVMIVFNVSEPTNASLTIRDLQGRLLMDVVSGQIPEGQFSYQANLGKLATGLYIATLSMENGVFIAEKLVKQD
jgi:hypothetical protein